MVPTSKSSRRLKIDKETSIFLTKAHENGADLGKTLNDPERTAKDMKIKISENVVKRIKSLNDTKSASKFNLDDPINKEIIEFYNKVVINGQYLKEWTSDPEKVAKKLKVTLSSPALERLKKINIGKFIDKRVIGQGIGNKFNPGVAIVVIIVIVLWTREIFDHRRIIIDKSGIAKF